MFPFSAFDGYETLVLTIMDILGDLPNEWIPRWESIQQASKSPEPLDPESTSIPTYKNESFPLPISVLVVGSIPVVGCGLAEIYPKNANVGPLTPSPLGANGRRPNPLIYYGTEKFPEETLRILVPVIKGLLTYTRSSRLSASQALQMLEKLKIGEGDGRPVLL